MKTIAFETANSYIKVFDAETDNVLIYPNTIREAPIESYGNAVTTYEINGRSWQAGIRRKFSTSSSKGQGRYKQENFYIETLIALSQVVEDNETVIAVTGLPANHYTKAVIADLKKLFETTHYLKIDGVEKSFTIDALDVFLQPLGSFFYSIIDDDGAKRKNYDTLIDSDILVVDIGFGSTDLAEISVGALVDYKETGVSMMDAYESLFASMKHKYRNRKIEEANIHPLQLEIETRDAAVFEFSGEKYPIADLKESVFRETAAKIISRVSNAKDFSQFDHVIFTGGGVTALQDYLSSIEATNAVPLLNAQEANVRGFSNFSRFQRAASKKKK